MLSVIILGTGNVAQQLCQAFSMAKGVRLLQVYGRNPNHLHVFENYAETCSNPSEIKYANVYLIAVKDDAISTVSELLSGKRDAVIAHTSGATSLEDIAHPNSGVFYPLQTFTVGRTLNFKTIPICIEAQKEDGSKVLRQLAECISEQVHYITSEQRKKLHLAAVFVNNFPNYLYGVGEAICQSEGLQFDLLKPLILETAQKVQEMTVLEAQTGPARRGDENSLQNHLALLKDEKYKELYIMLSAAIKSTYEEKL